MGNHQRRAKKRADAEALAQSRAVDRHNGVQRAALQDTKVREVLSERRTHQYPRAVLAEVMDAVDGTKMMTWDDLLIALSKLRTEWVRPIAEWEVTGKGVKAQSHSLIEHLFCKYPTPAFLYSTLQTKWENQDDWKWVKLFVDVASGQSAVLSAKVHINIPWTKKMVHQFMASRTNAEPQAAARMVQVNACATDQGWVHRLHHALCAKWSTVSTTRREEFRWTIIQWLGKQVMMDPDQVGPMLDYIDHCREVEPNWSIKGRTVTTVTRGMLAWHATLAREASQRVRGDFIPSGFRGYEVVRGSGDTTTVVNIKEILSTSALASEGRTLGHCVFSYANSVTKGTKSIWSLGQSPGFDNGEGKVIAINNARSKLVTIEVVNQARRIVQMRGRFNRMVTPAERNHITQWAKEAGLVMGRYS